MLVYVEQVILDNLIINYILLFVVSLCLKEQTTKTRLFFASSTGTIFAVLFPMFNVGGFVLIILKILLGMVLILIAFEYKTMKKCLLEFFAFLFLTAIFGGLCFALLLALDPNIELQNGTFVYSLNIPIGIYILLIAVISKLLVDISGVMNVKIQSKKFEYDMIITNDKNKLKVKVYLDTGNLLCENGRPIIIINFKTFKKLFNIETIDFLKGNYKIQNSRYIEIDMATKKDRMLVFNVDNVSICLGEENKKIVNAVLGLSTSDLKEKIGCDAIMGYQVLS